MQLEKLVKAMADAWQRADALRPVAVSQRGTRTYQPGIGPHSENVAVALMLEQLRASGDAPECGQFVPYPAEPRQKCDLWFGNPPEWVVEVKMARFQGDNGKPDDTALKDILSPYPADRSAVGDCSKLAASGFVCRKAIVIYGFEYPDRPLAPAITAFEAVAREYVELGTRHEAEMGALVHPVHSSGRVFAWEVLSSTKGIPPGEFDYRLVVEGILVSPHLIFRGPLRVGDTFPLAEGGGYVTKIIKDDEGLYEIHVVPIV